MKNEIYFVSDEKRKQAKYNKKNHVKVSIIKVDTNDDYVLYTRDGYNTYVIETSKDIIKHLYDACKTQNKNEIVNAIIKIYSDSGEIDYIMDSIDNTFTITMIIDAPITVYDENNNEICTV